MVNPSDTDQKTAININGVNNIFTGTASVLTSANKMDENSFAEPTKVAPVEINNDFTVKATFNSDKLQPNSMLETKASITNNKSSKQSVLVIVALYDGGEKMVNMSYISKDIPIGDTENLNAGFKLPANKTNYKARVFVWDGSDLKSSTMQPLSNIVKLP